MTTVPEVLDEAADLLSKDDAWVWGLPASDDIKEWGFNPRSNLATCWDTLGAITKCSPVDNPELEKAAIRAVLDYLGLDTEKDLMRWNDDQAGPDVPVDILRLVAIGERERMVKKSDNRYGSRERGSFAHKCWQHDTSFDFFGFSGYEIRGLPLSLIHSNPEGARIRRAKVFYQAWQNLDEREIPPFFHFGETSLIYEKVFYQTLGLTPPWEN